MTFTDTELDLLFAGLDAIEPGVPQGAPQNPLLMIAAATDPAMLDRFKAEQRQQETAAHNQFRMRKEQVILLKAKLVGIRQSAAADQVLAGGKTLGAEQAAEVLPAHGDKPMNIHDLQALEPPLCDCHIPTPALLGVHAEMMNKIGADCWQAQLFIRQHRHRPDLVELADTARRLKSAAQRQKPGV